MKFDDHPVSPGCTPITQVASRRPKMDPIDLSFNPMTLFHYSDVRMHPAEILTPAGAMRKGADEKIISPGKSLERRDSSGDVIFFAVHIHVC